MNRSAAAPVAAVGALLLAAAIVPVNSERACAAREGPVPDWCPPWQSRFEATERYLGRNPGDSTALLAHAAAQAPAARASDLGLLARLAPNDEQVVRMRARSALEAGDYAAAAEQLVKLAQDRRSDDASAVLARLVAAGHAREVAEQLHPGDDWPGRMLEHLEQLRAPPALAGPLVAEALRRRAISPAHALLHVRRLRQAGAWVDAFAVWTVLNGGKVPVLYNASFDTPFVRGGFDWEPGDDTPAARAGVELRQTELEGRGGVLDVRLRGKPFRNPIVRQYTFLRPGSWRLSGNYMTRGMRVESGLVWQVHCPDGAQPEIKSPTLQETNGTWKLFVVEFTVPPACGQSVAIALETAASYEAEAGASGTLAFDAFTLEQGAAAPKGANSR